jgi:hypothetical protein
VRQSHGTVCSIGSLTLGVSRNYVTLIRCPTAVPVSRYVSDTDTSRYASDTVSGSIEEKGKLDQSRYFSMHFRYVSGKYRCSERGQEPHASSSITVGAHAQIDPSTYNSIWLPRRLARVACKLQFVIRGAVACSSARVHVKRRVCQAAARARSSSHAYPKEEQA